MTKSEELRSLLERNRSALLLADPSAQLAPNGICYDGIVDETTFYSDGNTPRVLFLLKETNGNDPRGNRPDVLEDWDYRGWLEHQQARGETSETGGSCKFYRTFYALCMWLDIFYDCAGGRVMPFSEYRDSGRLCDDSLRENLLKTAILNLKKTWGGGSASWGALNAYLQNDTARNVLRQQVGIIGPDVVICGGRQVFDFARMIFDAQEEHLPLRNGETSIFRSSGAVFLDFYHPACRKSREFLYQHAAEVFQALLEKGIC